MPTQPIYRFSDRCSPKSVKVLLGGLLILGGWVRWETVAEHEPVEIVLDGKLLTRFHYGPDLQKPFFYPVLGARGEHVTRGYPIEDRPNEAKDHPHHVSLWFAHGDVNGHDFWHGPKGERIVVVGEPEVATERSAAGREAVTLNAQLSWRDADGVEVVREDRTIRFLQPEDATRVMDFHLTLTAPANEAATFGDTKEGTFAIRLAPTLRLKGEVAAGHILNSQEEKDAECWGKRAGWVAYYGPVDDSQVTVAIFDHPDNPRHPTWWHARDYGLFAANPFGAHDFEGQPKGTGDLTVPAGESIEFKYRIVLHSGEADGDQLTTFLENWASVDER